MILDQCVLLGPILMDQYQFIEAEAQHFGLKVDDLRMVLEIQIKIEYQYHHLVIQFILSTHQGPHLLCWAVKVVSKLHI